MEILYTDPINLLGENMTWFNCKCGESFRDSDSGLSSSGIMIRLSALRELEKQISVEVNKYILVPENEKHQWALNKLGVNYTPERYHEIIEDLVSRAINESKFLPTFECPQCGQLGIKGSSTKDEWEFYVKS